jgi:hypothetical protein
MRGMRTLIVAALVLAVISTPRAEGQTPADLRFLVGSWTAESGPPGSAGSSTFRLDLAGKVLVRTNHAEYPAMQGRPASSHDDLMIVYLEGASPLRAVYFDSEGHVIHYRVASLAADKVVFISEPGAGETAYRLSYAAAEGGRLAGEFASAPVGGEPKPMFQWTLKPADKK